MFSALFATLLLAQASPTAITLGHVFQVGSRPALLVDLVQPAAAQPAITQDQLHQIESAAVEAYKKTQAEHPTTTKAWVIDYFLNVPEFVWFTLLGMALSALLTFVATKLPPTNGFVKFLHLLVGLLPEAQKAFILFNQVKAGQATVTATPAQGTMPVAKVTVTTVATMLLVLGLSGSAQAQVTVGPAEPLNGKVSTTVAEEQKAQLLALVQHLMNDVNADNLTGAVLDAQGLVELIPSKCIDLIKGTCHARIGVGPAIGLTLFSIEGGHGQPTVLKGPDFGGGGVQGTLDFWPDKDGDYMLHVSIVAMLGGGTVNSIRTASVLEGLTLGFGGFGKVPLFCIGPSVRESFSGGAVQFAMVGNGATVAAIQSF